MGPDISDILNGWAFDPHELTVRIVPGQDGQEKIQMRIELGVLQMNVDGRPDGQRPHDCESLLEYYQQQARDYGEGYRLSREALDDLFREAWQYYQRYLSLFHLQRFDKVIRDTDRNIRLFDFVREHAKRRRERWRFDQYRPYVLMMNARSKALSALENGQQDEALTQIAAGRQAIEAFLAEYDRPVGPEESFELEFLTRWEDELRQRGPTGDENLYEGPDDAGEGPASLTEADMLRQQLDAAVAQEDYETAAQLRDEIKRLSEQDPK